MKYYFLALATGMVVCVGCATNGDTLTHQQRRGYVAPPANMMARPGPMVDGPGPGVIQAMASSPVRAFVTRTTQIRFVAPAKMAIGWQIQGGFADSQIIAPNSYDFVQGATYRLKLAGIPGRDKPLYPTLQVYPAHPTTDAYLAHNSIPIALTAEDLDQIASSNYVTKVIYLPDAKFQDLVADVDVLVSTRLEPGVDPIAEADRRGTIMAVVRVGNKEFREMAAVGMGDGVQQASFVRLDGGKGELAPPLPIGPIGGGFLGIPGPMIVGSYGRPGQPAVHPISGVAGIPKWGMPITGTPIGLPGPPHLPYGGPAGLKRHTIVNTSRNDIGRPVNNMLIEVEHNPGYRLPKPVSYIKYTENHPHYPPHQVSYPAAGGGLGGVPCPGGNCPH